MFLDGGWNNPENWGVWSSGEHSSITLPMAKIKEPVQLQFDVHGYVPKEAPFIEVDVYANSVFQNKWSFQYGDSKVVRSLDIAPSLIAKNHGLLNIDFRINNARSPSQLGRGADKRLLGIGIKSLHIKLLDTQNKQ